MPHKDNYILVFAFLVLNAHRIGVSPNGWTDGELAAKWIVDDFDR
jgi:hypothetical protein